MEAVKRIPAASKVQILLATWRLTVPEPKKLQAELNGLLAVLRQLNGKEEGPVSEPSSPKE